MVKLSTSLDLLHKGLDHLVTFFLWVMWSGIIGMILMSMLMVGIVVFGITYGLLTKFLL